MGSDEDCHREPGSDRRVPDAGLARDLSELARELLTEQDLETVLDRIVKAAVSEVEAAEDAGISEIAGRTVHTRAATGDFVLEIDKVQYESDEGPCLDSLRNQVTVRVDELRGEERWPVFARAAADRGLRSMIAVQLFVEGDNLGALNLYARTPNAFGPDDESAAMLLAAHAAVAMKGTTVESNLRAALKNRDVIGQAKGVLMERYKINADQAFDLLVVASQRNHRKLFEIADEVAGTGVLPTPR